jgi:hypothetical protein
LYGANGAVLHATNAAANAANAANDANDATTTLYQWSCEACRVLKESLRQLTPHNYSNCGSTQEVQELDQISGLLDMFAGLAYNGVGKRFVAEQELLVAVVHHLSRVHVPEAPVGLKEQLEVVLLSGLTFVHSSWSVCSSNQELVTAELISVLSSLNQLNMFVRQLLVDSFTMTEHVCVTMSLQGGSGGGGSGGGNSHANSLMRLAKDWNRFGGDYSSGRGEESRTVQLK